MNAALLALALLAPSQSVQTLVSAVEGRVFSDASVFAVAPAGNDVCWATDEAVIVCVDADADVRLVDADLRVDGQPLSLLELDRTPAGRLLALDFNLGVVRVDDAGVTVEVANDAVVGAQGFTDLRRTNTGAVVSAFGDSSTALFLGDASPIEPLRHVYEPGDPFPGVDAVVEFGEVTARGGRITMQLFDGSASVDNNTGETNGNAATLVTAEDGATFFVVLRFGQDLGAGRKMLFHDAVAGDAIWAVGDVWDDALAGARVALVELGIDAAPVVRVIAGGNFNGGVVSSIAVLAVDGDDVGVRIVDEDGVDTLAVVSAGGAVRVLAVVDAGLGLGDIDAGVFYDDDGSKELAFSAGFGDDFGVGATSGGAVRAITVQDQIFTPDDGPAVENNGFFALGRGANDDGTVFFSVDTGVYALGPCALCVARAERKAAEGEGEGEEGEGEGGEEGEGEGDEDAGGCGCAEGGAGSGALVLLGLLGVRRRRR